MLLVLGLWMSATGCVHRRLMIRSNPPGALVFVDNQEIGTTPAAVEFTYYGTRKIQLVLDGYETVTDYVAINAPWYQYFPLDFVSENLVPTDIRDIRNLQYEMQPRLVVPTQQILNNGEQLRANSGGGRP